MTLNEHVVFEPLPDDRRSPQWMRDLKDRPNAWGRLPNSGNTSGNLRKRHRDYEFVSRMVDGERVVYGRYVGPIETETA